MSTQHWAIQRANYTLHKHQDKGVFEWEVVRYSHYGLVRQCDYPIGVTRIDTGPAEKNGSQMMAKRTERKQLTQSALAHTIATVIDLLASADDALQRYNYAIESWCDQLQSLKDLEDDLDILYVPPSFFPWYMPLTLRTQRHPSHECLQSYFHRSSRLITPLTGLGPASLVSIRLPPPIPPLEQAPPAPTANSPKPKQNYKRAKPIYLVTKERELDARRISIARDGLGARCRALIDCGWVWGDGVAQTGTSSFTDLWL